MMRENINKFIETLKNNISFNNIYALLETGSSINNLNTKNSDYDIRIIVNDYKLIYSELEAIIKTCKTISLLDKDNYSEYKFYFNSIPIHLIFYDINHVNKCLDIHKRSFLSTILEGRVLYSDPKEFDSIYKECVKIKELIISDDTDLTSAKSLFVKAMSKFQNGYYEDSIFCFRYASTHLIKYYLLKKGVIFLKEQWVLKKLREICEKENDNAILTHYRRIHGFEEGQTIDAKDSMINFTALLAYVERYHNE